MDTFSLVAATPDGALFLAGQSGGFPMLWLSLDLGQTFAMRMAPCDVTGWAFFDKNNFFVGGYDGTKGLVYRTGNGGQFYTEPAEAGAVKIVSVALSPNYASDKTVAVGNTSGQVFISADNGVTFRQLGQQLPVTAGVGTVSVAFDRDFPQNGNVYAVVDTKTTTTSKERVFRFTNGRSTVWQSITGGLPVDAQMKNIAMTESGTLYVLNGQVVAAADGKGGIMRCINPTLAAPPWETVTGGLEEGVAIKGLWASRNQLWSIDIGNAALMTMVDTLSSPTALVSPQDAVSGVGTDILLSWRSSEALLITNGR